MLLSKKYVFGHVAVILVVVSCVMLSFWQFSRLSERKDLNSKIRRELSDSTHFYNDLVATYDEPFCVECIQYRRAELKGTFNVDGEVLISGRSRNGEPGYNVATPLELKDPQGEVGDHYIYINRGWIPQSLGDAIKDGRQTRNIIEPVGGYKVEQQIVGFVRKNEPKRPLVSERNVSKDSRVSPRMSSSIFVDLLDGELVEAEFYIQMSYSIVDGKKIVNDSRENFPVVIPKPELTEKNHLSYAIQWLLFGFVAFVTWTIICRKALKAASKK